MRCRPSQRGKQSESKRLQAAEMAAQIAVVVEERVEVRRGVDSLADLYVCVCVHTGAVNARCGV